MPIEYKKELIANVIAKAEYKAEKKHTFVKYNAKAISIMIIVTLIPLLLSFFSILHNKWVELIVSSVCASAAIIIGVWAITKHIELTIREIS